MNTCGGGAFRSASHHASSDAANQPHFGPIRQRAIPLCSSNSLRVSLLPVTGGGDGGSWLQPATSATIERSRKGSSLRKGTSPGMGDLKRVCLNGETVFFRKRFWSR